MHFPHALFAASLGAAAVVPKTLNLGLGLGFDPDLASLVKGVAPPKIYQLNVTGSTLAMLPEEDLLAPHAGRRASSGPQRRFIIGADARFLYEGASYPFTASGKVVLDNGVWGTGSLIGPRHLLTVRHALAPDRAISFIPLMDNGVSRVGLRAEVVEAFYISDSFASCDSWKDFAIMVLDRPIGEEVGWLGVHQGHTSRFGQSDNWSLGYPGDRSPNGARPFIQTGFTPRSWGQCDNSAFISDMDIMGGQSGCALWYPRDGDMMAPYVFGLGSGQRTEYTIHTPSDAWLGVIQQVKTLRP